MSEFLKEQKKFKKYSQWAGGMEHIGIHEENNSLKSVIEYILAFKNQKLFEKNFINLDDDLFQKSKDITKQILKNFGNKSKYDDYSDMANVFDYTFIFYPQRVSEISKINKVLDFGAGYGRQANLFSDKVLQYWATDAIETSYATQNKYLSELAKINNKKYFDDLEENFIMDEIINSEGLFHIPSWNLNKIEDGYFDLIICSHILPELTEETFDIVFPMIMNLIRPNGFLYIRDHGLRWQPGHLYDVEKILFDNGFILEYSVFARDKNDIHGIPRIYRKLSKEITHRVPSIGIKEWKTK